MRGETNNEKLKANLRRLAGDWSRVSVKGALVWFAVGVALTVFFALLPVDESKGGAPSFIAVLPPLWAIIIAFALKKVFIALGAAVFLAMLLSKGVNPAEFLPHGLEVYFWDATINQFKGYILLFTLALVGMVNVSVRCGGMQGIVDKVSKVAKTQRAAKLSTAFLGMLIFFDDYANTVVIGTTMRRLTDFYRVSREKLAFIVDSTAAPIAGLAVVSTWIGYEVGLFSDVAKNLGVDKSGYELFFSAIPFRFYCITALGLVVINGFTGRDFGPMYKAEKRAREGKLWADGAKPLSGDLSRAAPKEGIPYRWCNAVIPIVVVVFTVFLGIIHDGGGFAKLGGDFSLLFSFEFIRDCFGNSENNTRVLAYASIAGSVVAIGLALAQSLLSFKEALFAWWVGARSMFMAIALLIFAWAVAASAEDLGTAKYLTALLGSTMPPFMVPVSVFFLASVVAFSTGTSWGAMAILLPTTSPLAYQLGGEPIMLISMAAVLDGAIFGDHCSPISDTTVMSSIASGCDHIDHVRTQIPYAVTAMVIAAGVGYLPAPLGLPVFAIYLLAFSLVIAAFYLLGKKPTA